MKILFVIKNTANLRTLAPVVRQLDDRGHEIRIACRDVKSTESRELLELLAHGSSGTSLVPHPFPRVAGWSELAASLRRTIDYLRYLEPVYRDSAKLRARAEAEAPASLRAPARLLGRIPYGAGAGRRVLQAVERCLEPPPQTVSFLAEHSPDVLMITPLIGFGTPQAEMVRAARRLGIPVCFPVRSWDNLTNKGLLRDAPDLVLVWNDLQAAEAVELHGVPAGRVVVTGAPAYDHWFDWRPSRGRAEFLAEVGLDPGRPVVLYVGSSEFIAPDEASFVGRWVEAIRAHGGVLRDVGILVRPHPLAVSGFRDLSFRDPQVAVWPRTGEFPIGGSARRNFFDSIFHSSAVVGINTSAQIESAIVGRPVHTILAGEFRETQRGTLHFRYLADEDFGHLRVAGTLEEHAAQLERSLAEGDDDDLNERFLRRFVRPFGLDVPATPLAADAIEALAEGPRPSPRREPILAPAVRVALRPLADRQARIRRQAKRASASISPLDELKRMVRKAARAGEPVAAGPWLGDEIGELLYWIPFLRWSTRSAFGLAERLLVVAGAGRAPWYGGLGARVVALDDPQDDPEEAIARTLGSADVVRLDPSAVGSQRHALSGHDPLALLPQRRLEFAPFSVPALGPAPDLPAGAVLVRAGTARAWAPAAVTRLLEEGPVVVVDAPAPLREELEGDQGVEWLDGLDRRAEAAALLRARGFLGDYSVSAYVAVLAGVPAVAVADPSEPDEHDVRLAGVLPRPPFGSLRIVPPAEAGPDHLAGLLQEDAGVPASV